MRMLKSALLVRHSSLWFLGRCIFWYLLGRWIFWSPKIWSLEDLISVHFLPLPEKWASKISRNSKPQNNVRIQGIGCFISETDCRIWRNYATMLKISFSSANYAFLINHGWNDKNQKKSPSEIWDLLRYIVVKPWQMKTTMTLIVSIILIHKL